MGNTNASESAHGNMPKLLHGALPLFSAGALTRRGYLTEVKARQTLIDTGNSQKNDVL